MFRTVQEKKYFTDYPDHVKLEGRLNPETCSIPDLPVGFGAADRHSMACAFAVQSCLNTLPPDFKPENAPLKVEEEQQERAARQRVVQRLAVVQEIYWICDEIALAEEGRTFDDWDALRSYVETEKDVFELDIDLLEKNEATAWALETTSSDSQALKEEIEGYLKTVRQTLNEHLEEDEEEEKEEEEQEHDDAEEEEQGHNDAEDEKPLGKRKRASSDGGKKQVKARKT